MTQLPLSGNTEKKYKANQNFNIIQINLQKRPFYWIKWSLKNQ